MSDVSTAPEEPPPPPALRRAARDPRLPGRALVSPPVTAAILLIITQVRIPHQNAKV